MAAFSKFEPVVDPRDKTFLQWASAFVLTYLGVTDDLPIPRSEDAWVDWFNDLQDSEYFDVQLPDPTAYEELGWQRYVDALTLVLASE